MKTTSQVNLKDVLQKLRSTKITDRRDGLLSFRTIFENTDFVENFHLDSKGKAELRSWLVVFQALFENVLIEKVAATKKESGKSGSLATAQRRLEEAASTVRWLTERTVHLMNQRITRPLIEHFLQTMVHKGEILTPVALHYTKALRSLVQHTPHLENMDDNTWVRMVEMNFNVLLGDPIRANFEDDDVNDAPSASEADDSELFDDDEEPAIPQSTSKKRFRIDPPATHPHTSPKPSQTQRKVRPISQQVSVSHEQVESMSLLSLLLGSSSSPITSAERPYLASSILVRLQRFLELYTGDTSLVHDYLVALSSTLFQVSLNRTHEVAKFARRSWDALLGLWGTKNKRIKEGLVSVLHVLMPFVTTDNEAYNNLGVPFDCVVSLGKLSAVLDGEAESRWGIDGLSLDCLRLEMVDSQQTISASNSAFVANSFRYGWNFDGTQALAWAILELQADCIAKLFQLSEAMHTRGEGKRIRLESPITTLLNSVKEQSVSNIRAYHLQILLFVIDRHFLVLHDPLQQDIVTALHQFIHLDDATVQSWVFMCFAAIAYAIGSLPDANVATSHPLKSLDVGAILWDGIWTNAVRRANVPGVSRAACHAAYIILTHTSAQKNDHAQLPLASSRVLLEIETLAKDLEVQGPPFPYDSVCAFLSSCLRVASQDMHLYRMHLEEHVLPWLVACWQVTGYRSRTLSLYMVKDLVMLLESICGLSKRSSLVSRIPLPEVQIVTTLVNETKTKVIKDFLLNAKLPPFVPTHSNEARISPLPKQSITASDSGSLAQPGGRERRISAFFIKTLEHMSSQWGTNTLITAETARQALDLAVTALSFETVLVLNGTVADRRLIQCACKLVGIVTALLTDGTWTIAEKALITLGLDPLTRLEDENWTEESWSAMVPPNSGSGIQSQVLSRLSQSEHGNGVDVLRSSRLEFLGILWQNADIQNAFSDVSNTLRHVFRISLGDKSAPQPGLTTMEVDEQDGFGPIRTSTDNGSAHKDEGTVDSLSSRFTLDSCISFLTVGPTLQSASGEPTRDKDLIDTILGCAEPRPELFLLVVPIVLEKVQQRILSLSVKSFDSFLEELSRFFSLYQYAKSHRLQSLVTQFLSATLDVWAAENISIGDTLVKAQQLSGWLSKALDKKKLRSWVVRDLLARFFDKYLQKDPIEKYWPENDQEDVNKPPSSLLPTLAGDDDVRVRFRCAVLNAHLFANSRYNKTPIEETYIVIKNNLTKSLDDYERMLTRILMLGNIMIVGSAVRRGAYWHLLEASLHTPLYSGHIEVVLRGVSKRLGLVGFSSLFETYASQLALSLRSIDADFLSFPPRLLGYHDRKECANANFRSFAPTDIWIWDRDMFEGHCKIISQSVSDGLRSCFGDIIGYQVVAWIGKPQNDINALGSVLRTLLSEQGDFDQSFAQNIDGIVASVLRSLGDQDFSGAGPIVTALQTIDPTGLSASIFRGLTRYRNADDIHTHLPNLPAFPAKIILQGLQWLRNEALVVDEKATTYHVLRQLFSDVDRTPLVNEQFRLINSLCLWIATHPRDFQDSTLLHLLIHGASTILGQIDLARSAQSILEWAFACYRKVKTKHPRIPDILVRISCCAHDYSQTNSVPGATLLGSDLREWIDIQVFKLSQVSSLSSQVMRALPAWPHQPSPQLAQLCQSITEEHLSSVLGDHRIASSKFKLTRRLRDHALSQDYNTEQFAQQDFWRLKECIPCSGQLQDADVDAFADLLYLNQGRLDSVRGESINPTSTLNRHKIALAKVSSNRIESAKEPIFYLLLSLVHGDSTSQSNSAYETLRLIKAVEVNGENTYMSLSEHEVELEFLGKYLRPPRIQTPQNIGNLIGHELYLDAVDNFPRWIAEVTILLSDVLSGVDSFYAQMTPILRSNPAFAEQVLPILVFSLLEIEQRTTNTMDGLHRSIISQFFSLVLSSSHASVRCLRSVIDVVLHLRHFDFGQPLNASKVKLNDALSYNKWLDIDCILLAKCSITCGAYTTALLFLELATEGSPKDAPIHSSEEILYEIYRHIDEPDGFYGIHDDDLHQNLLRRFHHENQWERAFRFHGAALEAGDTIGHAGGLVKSFHSFGFDHLANDALRTAFSSREMNNDGISHNLSYRLAWRTETWDLPESSEPSSGSSVYLALRAVHRERDERTIDNIVRKCLTWEMDRLRRLGLENFAEIREVVRDILCLHEIDKWRQNPIQSCLSSRNLSTGNWDQFSDIDPHFDFSNLENIMATRISLVRFARQKEQRQQIGDLVAPFTRGLIDIENRCLVRLSKAARAENEVQIALNSIVRARGLEKLPCFSTFEEFANVLWCQKEEKIAVEYLGRLSTSDWKVHVQDAVRNEEKALVLARLGTWSSAACLRKAEDIQSDYFSRAIQLLDNTSPSPSTFSQAEVYRECAMFAERQYYDIVKSPDAVRWKLYVDRKVYEIDLRNKELLTLPPNTHQFVQLDNVQKKAKRLLEADQEAFRNHSKAHDTFLRQAVDMYSRSLQVSDTHDRDGAIRLCSLWFANFEDDKSDLQGIVGQALERVPSRKFTFLSHQLSARISNPTTGQRSTSQANLQNLVLRMCKEHPFHSLYQVYCLQPDRSGTSSTRRQSTRLESPLHMERNAAASEIFERLRGIPAVSERLRDLELLCDACLQWAKHPIKSMKYKPRQVMKLPKELKISRISNLRVPVLTHHTPLDPTMKYNDCPWIDHYESDWTVAGGINTPKINVCLGTDGVKYKQLFKGEGEDDLRQDAVMEQVFDLVNGILHSDRETRRRLLDVRDYKVIPLASQAGLLEFVGNTLPLSAWLPPAHAKYRPQDLAHRDTIPKLEAARKEAKAAATEAIATELLISVYEKLSKRIHPVMRHFFTEKHKTPNAWFTMRLNYTRSVATTSIVGHVLGLGDRHTSNILIDQVSGQVVHIDLGIAFDQGKILAVPELVPFRMTRDMVDGMGTSGTSGVFQRCAEETLRVLRDGSEVIMTVLEVFKHDPLHSWTASDTKIQRAQEGASAVSSSTARFGVDIGIDMSSGSAEEAADRALSSVSRKLDKSLGVQSVVTQLVREATDVRNLARIYHGWSPLL